MQLLLLTIRYFTEGAFDPIAVFAGLVQTAIYADFGYIVCLSPLSSDRLLDLSYRTCPLCPYNSRADFSVRHESPPRPEIRVTRLISGRVMCGAGNRMRLEAAHGLDVGRLLVDDSF